MKVVTLIFLSSKVIAPTKHVRLKTMYIKSRSFDDEYFVSEEEMRYANSVFPTHFDNIVRYKKRWRKDVPVSLFAYNGKEGSYKRRFDLFGDGTILLINIPGHCAGLSAVKISGKDGFFVLLDADGAYSAKNWEEMVPSGIAANRKEQMKSLEWIRKMS